MTRTIWLAAALATVALTGCGGGDGGYDLINSAPDKVPASALSSPQAYTQYVGSLPANESGEALSVEGVSPPVTDTEEPLKLS